MEELDQYDAPEEAPEPEVEAPDVEASEVEAQPSVHGRYYRILSDRMVYGKAGDVVHLVLDTDTEAHLVGSGHLAAAESGPEPE